MWFSTLWSRRLEVRVLFTGALALASLQQTLARSQPHELHEGTVKQWEGLNLSLKTSWNAGPYILELLECAALENQRFYFTLLKLLGSETIKLAQSDKQIYESLVSHVETNDLLDHRLLPTWKFCISIRETSPRIEAHYQYYLNNIDFPKGERCPVWFDDGARQSCNPNDIAKVKPESVSASRIKEVAFDRLSTDDVRKGAIVLYIDILGDGFPSAYLKMVEAAEAAGIAYKIRYRPSPSLRNAKPVVLSGYGVSLVLKKTDYMVIDDRDAKDGSSDSSSSSSAPSDPSAAPSPKYKFKAPENLRPGEERFPLWDLEDIDDPVRGLRDIPPLSRENLADLGFKTANFIARSGIYPPDMLMKISADFPTFAHTIGTMGGVQPEFLEEYNENREAWLNPGFNAMFLNGLMLDPSEVTATTLLEIMRRERKYTLQIRSLGLDQKETLDLITHENITDSQSNEEKPRFDWREQEEEEGAILWLNNLETDDIYQQWSDSITDILIPTYGGQLASIRKNIHTLIVPIDFSTREDLLILTQKLSMFVQRGLALRIGIIPVVRNNLGAANSRVFAALLDSYDLMAATSYIRDGLEANKLTVRYPSQEYIEHVTGVRQPNEGKDVPSLASIMDSKEGQAKSRSGGTWESRLGVTTRPYPFFINGVGQAFTENWINAVTNTLPADVQRIQAAVNDGELTDDSDIAGFLLGSKPLKRRNTAIFADEDANLINLSDLYEAEPDILAKLPYFPGSFVEESETSSADVWIIGDFDIASGYNLLSEAAQVQETVPGISITAISNPSYKTQVPSLSTLLHFLAGNTQLLSGPGMLRKILEEVKPQKDFVDMNFDAVGQKILGDDAKTASWGIPDKVLAEVFWREAAAVFGRKLKIKPGERAVMINGRLLGPFGNDVHFTKEDIDALIEVELKSRIRPVLEAVKSMGALDRLRSPNAKGKLTSAMAILQTPQTTGIINRSSNARTNLYNQWKTKQTALISGDPIWSTFRFVVSLDPLSETAQKWAPILRVLMSMDGVGIFTFLNPRGDLTEVPIKRYYRHVLYSQPRFEENGDILEPKAQFIGLPDKTLYSLSMDVPPAWLVTPSQTIHDLDNIKLQTFKEKFGTADLNATYMLTNILIEGHSRDTSLNQPSAGAQLELGISKNPVMEDTLIMQNLGYFQFKSNPGHWQIRLKAGRSSDVFSIQSLGMDGFSMADNTEDDVKEVTLMSLRGVTLFPRLKRNKGYLKVDVFGPLSGQEERALDKGKKLAGGFLSKLGFGKKKVQEVETIKPPAEINIFSVASGHLYERFLNIMMVSVMRHTKHTVKFWFIENFLSPAFKDFIPSMAKEYNFDYELVTYKWPHWLRQQKEKQREIWGYKILFLDVLFPLNLDKIIFVDADQIVRTDLKELVDLDLEGAPYGFTPMCDSREEIEGFRFWHQGYWKSFLGDLKYHISALFVVDLKLFRQLAAGDRLRQQYHQLSADPNSLANLDQDLPNNMQRLLPIFSLPQDWLWCETWCSDESLATAKTIDLCNNPMTKEPKLDRARRQIPEWTEYDNEIAELAKKLKASGIENMREALVQKEALGEQERTVREDISGEQGRTVQEDISSGQERTVQEDTSGGQERTVQEDNLGGQGQERAVPPRDEL